MRSLALGVGDLQPFHGRYSLHRVREVRGRNARLSAIFAYSANPDVVGSRGRTRRLFGRVSPLHGDESQRSQADGLLG
ncbi:hypothetical protein ABIA39_007119 [Nocardia sp. GAS34]